jgi:hypothetical protein
MHKHHKVPRHAGGTNDLDNIVLLTVEEHAEAHRLLFEQYGRWQDELAWLTLSGQVPHAEAHHLGRKMRMKGNQTFLGKTHGDVAKAKISAANKGRKFTIEHKQKLSEARRNRVTTDETRRKLSESMKGHQHTLGKIYSIESKKRMSEAQKSRRLREKVGTS